MNENVNDFLNSMGAIAEMLGIFRENLKNNGFNESDSLYLCSSMVKAIIINARNTEKSER